MPTLLANTETLIKPILDNWAVDAVYLYGSRAKGLTHAESDWDIAILFSQWEPDKLEALLRPQAVEAELQRTFKLYDKISVVDLELAPTALQVNIVKGIKLYDKAVPHIRRIENSIASKLEIDYA